MRAPALPGWASFAQAVTPHVTEAAFFAGLLFVIGYTILAPWWKSQIGITIILLDLMIALVLLPGNLHYLFGVEVAGSEGWTFLALGALTAVPLIICWRFVILLRAQLRRRKPGDG